MSLCEFYKNILCGTSCWRWYHQSLGMDVDKWSSLLSAPMWIWQQILPSGLRSMSWKWPLLRLLQQLHPHWRWMCAVGGFFKCFSITSSPAPTCYFLLLSVTYWAKPSITSPYNVRLLQYEMSEKTTAQTYLQPRNMVKAESTQKWSQSIIHSKPPQ